MKKSYDVIITGARCGGASLAIFLAKEGFEVLLLDKAVFPSDTLSTNTFFNNTTALLREMGVLESLLESNVTPVKTIKFQFEDTVIEGAIPSVNGEDTGYSIRRMHLDYMLQQQVKGEISVTMIEGFRVTDVIMEADTVIGVKGQDRTNNKQEYHASIVVGADGRHSLIRKLVQSQLKISSPTTVAVYFGYFTGFSHDVVPKFEVYKRKDKTVILFPTNDDAYAVVVNFPLKDTRLVADFKKNPEKSLREILTKQFPNTSLGARIMPARLAEPMKGILGYENYWYQGMGKGWALVGDAICFKDPGMAQGIHDAIRGAQILADILKKKEWLQNQWDKTVMEYQQLIEDEFMARFYMGCEISKNKLVTEQQDAVNKIISTHPSVINKLLGIYNYANEPADFEKELMKIMSSVP